MSVPGGETVLVVDDEEMVRRSVVRVLGRHGYRCEEAAGAEEALAALAARPAALVLTDVNMPGRSGLWLAEQVLAADTGTAVVMVTGVDDAALATTALELGAYGYVIKPFEPNEILINVVNALRRRWLERQHRQHREELTRLVDERTASLRETLEQLAASETALRASNEEAIQRLALAAEYHDPCTGLHLQRMSGFAAALARAAGLPPDHVELIRLASPMHDLGKIGVPDEILRKPGRLDAAEMAEMRRHPQIGHDLLADSRSRLLRVGATIALTHHERFDGGGYPNGTSGHDIPIEGRIVAVADVFDALLNARPYKPAFTFEASLDVLVDGRGAHFDPDLVDAFLGVVGEVAVIAGRREEAAQPAPEPLAACGTRAT